MESRRPLGVALDCFGSTPGFSSIIEFRFSVEGEGEP